MAIAIPCVQVSLLAKPEGKHEEEIHSFNYNDYGDFFPDRGTIFRICGILGPR